MVIFISNSEEITINIIIINKNSFLVLVLLPKILPTSFSKSKVFPTTI